MREPLPVLLLRFVTAETWTASLQILHDNEDALLSDRADAGLGVFTQTAEAAADDAAAEMFRVHRALLRRCRRIGILAAFAEMDGGRRADTAVPTADLHQAAGRAGDRRSAAAAHLELGERLVGQGDLDRAGAEFEEAGLMFAALGAPFEASAALLNAGVARHTTHGAQAGVALFTAAQRQVDLGADLPAPTGRGWRDVEVRLQAAWLDALIELDHDATTDIADQALGRCARILALTADDTGDDVAAYARYTAHHHTVVTLSRRGRFVEALPSALAVLDHRLTDDDVEWRGIARRMHATVAAARHEQGRREDAGRHFVAAALLAAPDHDVQTVDVALLGLRLTYRREEAELAELIADLPAAFEAAGDKPSTARLLLAHARARDLTPGIHEQDQHLEIAAEYRRAADLFADLGEITQEADARYGAGHKLSRVALLDVEHRDAALAELEHAERLFRAVAHWHGTGITLMGQAELLNRWYPDIERDDARIAHLSAATVEAFHHARRPVEEASARLLQAIDTALHDDDLDRFLERCTAAFTAHERGRAARILPTDRSFDDVSVSYTTTLLAKRIIELLSARPDDERVTDLVWGLDQIAKSRTLSDDLAAPALWQSFLTSDPLLAEATRAVEKAQFDLEAAVRRRAPQDAQEARETLDRARRRQHRRLRTLTDDSPTALDMTSVAPIDRRSVQRLLHPGEVFVSLTSCRNSRYLRTTLTPTTTTVEVVEAPGILDTLITRREHGRLDAPDERRLRDRMRSLLGPVDRSTTLIVCPDPALAAIPWHLLDAGNGELLGDQLAIAVIPAAGVLAQLRNDRPRPAPTTDYLGIADEAATSAAQEIRYVRDRWFPRSGLTLTTPDGSELADISARVRLLHVGTHAHTGGLQFDTATVTPLDLAATGITADLLLLTGCYLGAFAHDDNNEFFGIVRQLLVATGARAAVVSAEPLPDRAPVRFADLLVAALTGAGRGRPWGTVAPMPVGEAVRWARLTMRTLGRADLDDHDERTYWRPARRDPWWSPWFVVGDPAARFG